MHRIASPSRKTVQASAIAAFASRGYAGTSIHDILRATRLSKPTLYYHFGSKEGLFRSIIEAAYEEVFDIMQSRLARARTCRERLTEVAVGLFEFASRHRHLMRLLFAAAFAAPGEIPPRVRLVARRRRIFLLARKIMSECQRAGALSRAHTAGELANGFFGAVSHRIRTWLLRTEGRLSRRGATRTVDLFLNGAAGRRARP